MSQNLTEKELYELQFANDVASRLSELHQGKKFHDMQLKVHNAIFRDGYKRVFIRKGRKGGGTETVMYPVSRIAGTLPGSACYIIGPTQKGQCEILWDNRRIHNYLPRDWNAEANETAKRIRLPNESFIKIEGADNPDAARGWEGDIFVWDELKDHNPLSLKNCYPNLASRDGIWIVLGTPPTQKSNYYYQLEQEIKNDPDWFFIHWTIWDNPFLPGGKEWIANEKQKYIRNGEEWLWRIEYEAEYVFNAARKVLPNFYPDVHVVPLDVIMDLIARDKQNMRWICSIDPGYATCFAVLFACMNPYTGQMYFLDEIYSTDRNRNSAREMWPLIEQKQKQLHDGNWTTLYDNAALHFNIEVQAILKEKGRRANLVPTNKQKADEENYFRTANSMFAEPKRAYVAKNCQNFIWEVEEYETDENSRYPDEHNHQLDNLRYILKHLNYTQAAKQGGVRIVNKEPSMKTVEEELEEMNKKDDWVGFGGGADLFDEIPELF